MELAWRGAPQAPPVWRAPEGPQGQAAVPMGGGAWPVHTAPQAPPVWRAPEGPEGTGGLRGAAPNDVRRPSLAGGRVLRRPEHQRGHKQQHAARTARGRAGHAAVGDQAGQQTTSRKTAAHGRIDQPGPQDSTPGARNTGDRAQRPKHQQRHKHRASARHSKRGRHEPTPCANVLTHP